MANAPGTPPDPNAPKVVHTATSQTVVRDRTPVLVQDNSTKKAWIAGLSVLALALLVGIFVFSGREEKHEGEDVTVNRTKIVTTEQTATPAVVVTEGTASGDTEDVQVFVTNTERSIERLSRPDDAANQAEVEAIKRRMEDLRQADKAQAAAIRQELQASIARLEAQAAAAPSTSTTVTTTDSGTAVTTTTANTAPAGATTTTTTGATATTDNTAALDALANRFQDTSSQLSQLESTAAPNAAADVAKLKTDMAAWQTRYETAMAATGQQQADMMTQLDTELAAMESSVSNLPVK